MIVFIVLLVTGCCVYSAGVMILVFALGKVRPGSSSGKPYVSVIIAARNERSVIGACLASIMAQDYPDTSYEVIVADDRSSDGTTETLKHFQAVWNNLRVIRIDRVPEGISPKKNALSLALSLARGEIILQTDADCITKKTWISHMVRGFEEGVGMVTGLAPYLKEPGFLNSFIRHEYLWNAILSAGSIILGNATHASGRNLAFRRETFEKLGGYGAAEKILSGDDTLLLQRMQKHSNLRILTVPDVSTHVYSRAPGDLAAFVRQRIRHMSTGRFFSMFQITAGCIVYTFHFILILSLFLSIGSLRNCGIFTAVFLFKILIDGLAAYRTKAVLGLEVEWARFVLNEFLLTVYMAVMPFLGLIVPVAWKEK